jgi:hypothetical protein
MDSSMSEISELFDRDPLNYSEQNIATIVAWMRETQAQNELGARAPRAPKAAPKTTKGQAILAELFGAPSGAGPADDILKDLGLK